MVKRLEHREIASNQERLFSKAPKVTKLFQAATDPAKILRNSPTRSQNIQVEDRTGAQDKLKKAWQSMPVATPKRRNIHSPYSKRRMQQLWFWDTAALTMNHWRALGDLKLVLAKLWSQNFTKLSTNEPETQVERERNLCASY